MEPKAFQQALRNKVLFKWAPFLRPMVYPFFPLRQDPIFVYGNQKSGTSAVAALVARAYGLSHDIDVGGFRVEQYEALYAGRIDLETLIRKRARIEFSKGLIKEPNLTFLWPSLRALYPRGRQIFVVRNPKANIRSICNRLKIPGNLQQLDTSTYPEISPMWEAILQNRWVGEPGRDLNYIGRSAERWKIAAQQYEHHKKDTVLIRYEDFVKDKVGTIGALSTELGLSVTSDITPWVDVQYQPAGKKVRDYGQFFGLENLAIIERECGPLMRVLGYETSLE